MEDEHITLSRFLIILFTFFFSFIFLIVRVSAWHIDRLLNRGENRGENRVESDDLQFTATQIDTKIKTPTPAPTPRNPAKDDIAIHLLVALLKPRVTIKNAKTFVTSIKQIDNGRESEDDFARRVWREYTKK